MPRAPTTADVFNAIAEPRRRLIIEALSRLGDQSVSDVAIGAAVQTLVSVLRLPQPTVSKHLAVLLAVGLVQVQRRGRQRLYRLNAARLRPVHDWTRMFERFWNDQLLRIKERAEQRAKTARTSSLAASSGIHPLIAAAKRNNPRSIPRHEHHHRERSADH